MMEALLSQHKTERQPTQARVDARGRLRVLHLLNSFEVGGTERQAVELLKRLDRDRYDVRLAAIQRKGPLYEELAASYPNLLVFPLDSLYNANALRQMRRLRAYLQAEAIDVLHAHDFYAGWLGTLAAQFTGVKVIACQRHLRLSDRFIHAFGRRVINRLANRVVVNAELIREHVITSGTAAAEKVVVIRNGLSFACDESQRAGARAALLAELDLPDDALLIGKLANLRPVKGHRYLLEAAAQVVRQFPQAHFVLIGAGEMREELQTQARELGLGARAHWLGQRANAAEYNLAFDLAVLASLHEGLPNAVMEAMAAGTAVVATDVGGVRELIVEGETGYLAAPADEASLAARIISALQNQTERLAIAARGQTFVSEQFAMRRMVQATEKLYDELGGKALPANA